MDRVLHSAGHVRSGRRRGNAAAPAVSEYYDHCASDYRILWRTDENGTIHFGYFDDVAIPWRRRVVEGMQGVVRHTAGSFAAAVGLGSLLLHRRTDDEHAVRWLRIAASGRASRHDVAQQRMTDVCANAVALQPGQRVLDAGCGVCGPGLRLAARYGASVLALNLQRRQLAEARRRAGIDPAGARVRFSLQDYTEMGVAGASVDVVWGLESICHCDDKAAFIGEAHRVLRPGGRVVVADFFQSDRALSPDDARQLRTWTQGWAIPGLASVSGFGEALEAAGFRHVRYRDIGQHVVPSSRRLYKASLVAIPVDLTLRALGVRTAIQGRNVSAAYWQYRSLRAGAWTYGVFVAEK